MCKPTNYVDRMICVYNYVQCVRTISDTTGVCRWVLVDCVNVWMHFCVCGGLVMSCMDVFRWYFSAGVDLSVCVLTQSPRFVLPWPQATWVLVLSKKCMLLLQLVLWKSTDAHTASHGRTVTQFYFFHEALLSEALEVLTHLYLTPNCYAGLK